MDAVMKRIHSQSAADTEHIGEQIGAVLRSGEVIELIGDLGSGKTTFVRGLTKGFGSSDHVASPSFTLSREYRSGHRTLYHFDFYRLDDPGVMALELAELLEDKQGVVVIEWATVAASVLPTERVMIRFTPTSDDARTLEISYPTSLAYLFADHKQ
jgi:tRNA threonylcarbamoyladenosine biosynthesis protein TsaE